MIFKRGGDDIFKNIHTPFTNIHTPFTNTQVQKCSNVSEIFLLRIAVQLWVSNQWKDTIYQNSNKHSYFIPSVILARVKADKDGLTSPRNFSLLSLRERFDRIELKSSIFLQIFLKFIFNKKGLQSYSLLLKVSLANIFSLRST